MDGKTVIRFLGSIVDELPGIVDDSQNMADKDLSTWLDASCKAAEAASKIVVHCIDKNQAKLIKNEINNFEANEKESQEQLEQEFLIKKQAEIERIKKQIKDTKAELFKKINTGQGAAYSDRLKLKNDRSAVLADTRAGLKTILDIYENNISAMIHSEEYSEKDKRYFEECKRLLLKQYNKTIDI